MPRKRIETPPCDERVSDGYRTHPCPVRGKVQRDGKWYCGRHDPVAIAEKKQERYASWRAETDGRMARNEARNDVQRLAVAIADNATAETWDRERLQALFIDYRAAKARLAALTGDTE